MTKVLISMLFVPLMMSSLNGCPDGSLHRTMAQKQADYYIVAYGKDRENHYEMRLESYDKCRREFLNQIPKDSKVFRADTLVLFEAASIVSSEIVSCCLWTRMETWSSSTSYPYGSESFGVERTTPCYAQRILELAACADSAAIRRLREEDGGILLDGEWVHVFRAARQGADWQVSYFEFDEFSSATDK